jgi:predicted NBD/HSP70 family sugar kinase
LDKLKIGIDIGGTKTRVGVVSKNKVIKSWSTSTDKLFYKNTIN